MNNLNLSCLRDLVHQHLDNAGILHRFDDCYTFTEKSDVMLFSVYEPNKNYLDKVNAIQYFEGISKIHVLESSLPSLYYLEIIVPHE